MGQRDITRIHADFARSADTHLIRVGLPAHPAIDLCLENESIHLTGRAQVEAFFDRAEPLAQARAWPP